MDRFLERPEKTLIYINYKGGKVKISEIAEYLQVGKLTVEKDLQFLSEIIHNENFFIKGGKAYLDTNSPSVVDYALNRLYQDNIFFQILVLIFEKKIGSINQLSNILNVSKPTIYRKFIMIKSWLKEHNLELITNKSVKIYGDEVIIRNLMQQFYDFYLPRSLSDIKFFNKEQFINEISEICTIYGFKLSSQGLRKLVISLKIMHIRNRLSNYVVYDELPTEENSIYINIAKKLQSFFPNYINLKTKKGEIIYYATNLFNYLIREKKITIDEIYSSKDINIRYSIIFELLKYMSENFYFEFSSDIKLVEELSRYTELYYIDLRLGTNNRLSNLTSYVNICKEHPFYSLVKEVTLGLFRQYDFLPEIKEIDIFALYVLFSTSQLRIKKTQVISVAIVSESSFEQDMIIEYLTFRYGVNIKVYPLTTYTLKKDVFHPAYDLLINTGNIVEYIEETENLTLSPVLSISDKKKLDYKINKLLNKKLTKYTKLIVF